MVEGPEAWQRFTDAVKQVMSVSKDELKRREAAWKRERAKTKAKKASL